VAYDTINILKKEGNMQVFVVEMLRWGERELHSYVAGIYSTLEEAEAAAQEAEEDRGGKYVAEIAAFTVDQGRKRDHSAQA
jgi:hypothetical protein